MTLSDDPDRPQLAAAKTSLRELARQWKALDEEIRRLNRQLDAIVRDTAPDLFARRSVGVETAGPFLATAGDNTDRILSEAEFRNSAESHPGWPAADAPPDGTDSRGGDRAADSALYIITIVRMCHHEPNRE